MTEFLAKLQEWTDAAKIPWHVLDKQIVSLPEALDEEDISKVVAYSAGLPEIDMLASMITVDDPRDAFAALVSLSSMVRVQQDTKNQFSFCDMRSCNTRSDPFRDTAC